MEPGVGSRLRGHGHSNPGNADHEDNSPARRSYRSAVGNVRTHNPSWLAVHSCRHTLVRSDAHLGSSVAQSGS